MTITIEPKAALLSEELERLEDRLRDLLTDMGIEATISDDQTGNITISRVAQKLPEDLMAGFLSDWKEEQKKSGKIRLFEHTHSYRDSLDLDTIREAMGKGMDTLAMQIDDQESDNRFQWYEDALKEFLLERDIDISDYDISDFEEFRDAFEERFVWNIEALANYNVLLLDGAMYDIEFDGVTSDPDNVEDTDDFREFKEKALKLVSDDQFREILINCLYSGQGYIGAIVNAGDILESLQSGNEYARGRAMIGIHNWGVGSGYKIHSEKYVSIQIKGAFLDSGDYGIGGVFGESQWVH